MESQVRFRVLGQKGIGKAGTGTIVNISRTGILFTSENILAPGHLLELSLNWPAMLDNRTPLQMVARGRVVRIADGQAAIRIQQHQLRTAGKTAN